MVKSSINSTIIYTKKYRNKISKRLLHVNRITCYCQVSLSYILANIRSISENVFLPRQQAVSLYNLLISVVVQFYPWVNYYFLFFLGMVMCGNAYKMKENEN